MIAGNPDRKPRHLFTDREGGELITTYEAYNDEEEAEAIASETAGLVNAGRRYADIAVMYRTNAQSRPIEEALVRHRIPYRLIGGVRFYQRREVKDLVAYLRLIQNPTTRRACSALSTSPAGESASRPSSGCRTMSAPSAVRFGKRAATRPRVWA